MSTNDPVWKYSYLAVFFVTIWFAKDVLAKLMETGNTAFASLLLVQGAVGVFCLVMYVAYWFDERQELRAERIARQPEYEAQDAVFKYRTK